MLHFVGVLSAVAEVNELSLSFSGVPVSLLIRVTAPVASCQTQSSGDVMSRESHLHIYTREEEETNGLLLQERDWGGAKNEELVW